MALTISAIRIEALEIVKKVAGKEEVKFIGDLAVSAVLDVCSLNPRSEWKLILKNEAGSKIVEDLKITYWEALLGATKDKPLSELICARPETIEFFSAFLVKLFDAATFGPGEIPTFKARSEILGEEIVNSYLNFKNHSTKYAAKWKQRIVLDKSARKHFKFAGIYENAATDLILHKEDFSEDEDEILQEVSLDEIPEEHKLIIVETRESAKKRELAELTRKVNCAERELEEIKKEGGTLRKKKKAKLGIQTVAETICNFEQLPSIQEVKAMAQAFQNFCHNVSKTTSTYSPEQLLIFQSLQEIPEPTRPEQIKKSDTSINVSSNLSPKTLLSQTSPEVGKLRSESPVVESTKEQEIINEVEVDLSIGIPANGTQEWNNNFSSFSTMEIDKLGIGCEIEVPYQTMDHQNVNKEDTLAVNHDLNEEDIQTNTTDTTIQQENPVVATQSVNGNKGAVNNFVSPNVSTSIREKTEMDFGNTEQSDIQPPEGCFNRTSTDRSLESLSQTETESDKKNISDKKEDDVGFLLASECELGDENDDSEISDDGVAKLPISEAKNHVFLDRNLTHLEDHFENK